MTRQIRNRRRAIEPPDVTAFRMISGYCNTQAISVCAQLGIVDLLKKGARTAQQIATSTHTHPAALYRLMRALASLGILRELRGGRFQATAVGKTLQSDHPSRMHSRAILAGKERYRAWGQLGYSIRTGRPAFDHVFKESFYPRFATSGMSGQLFDQYISGSAILLGAVVARAYDFAGTHAVVDVGGGQGYVLTAILAKHRNLQGVLFDTQAVIASARRYLRRMGAWDRCRFVAGDYLQSIPPGGDIYLLARVIHGLDEVKALRVLKNCRRVMSNAKLLLVQQLITASQFGCVADLNMLVLFGGQERTAEEYEQLLRKAGFTLTKIIPTKTALSILEAEPA